MSKIIQFFSETKAELKQVVWPNRNQTILYTIVVIVLSVLVAYFLGLFDYLFARGLEQLLAL